MYFYKKKVMESYKNQIQEILDSDLNIMSKIDAIYKLPLPNFGVKPKAPYFKSNQPSAEEIKKYQQDLEIYQIQNDIYNKDLNINKSINLYRNDILVDLIKDESDFYSIPEQYQKKVYSKAYNDGHSAGYGEVYYHLCELVNIFK